MKGLKMQIATFETQEHFTFDTLSSAGMAPDLTSLEFLGQEQKKLLPLNWYAEASSM